MRSECDSCGLRLQREPGYYLGSIYFNYGLTALIVTVTYFVLFLTTEISPDTLLVALTAFCVLFPIWFFRYAQPVAGHGRTVRSSAARDSNRDPAQA